MCSKHWIDENGGQPKGWIENDGKEIDYSTVDSVWVYESNFLELLIHNRLLNDFLFQSPQILFGCFIFNDEMLFKGTKDHKRHRKRWMSPILMCLSISMIIIVELWSIDADQPTS